MARKRGKKKQHRFHSKAQWRWAFATRKPWARKWAHRSGGHSAITKRLGHSPAYRKLPRRKGIRKR